MAKISQKIKNSPTKPGCYLFKNNKAKVIYVGKAKNIKKRVTTYFGKTKKDVKTNKLVQSTVDVEFMVTDTEVEALLLEAQLIRQHQPQYNMELKHGIRYAYIRFTNETFPRLMTTRTIKPGDKVFGPYTSGFARQQVIRLANKVFELRAVNRKPRKVLDKWIVDLGVVPRKKEITPEDYQLRLNKVAMLLRGNTKDLIKKLETEMKSFSAKKNYEIAKQRRDQILALQFISEKQKVQLNKTYDQDIINYVLKPNTIVVQLFNINKGIISGRKEFKFPRILNKSEGALLHNFIQQYYYAEEIPQEVIIPLKLKEQSLLKKYLHKLAERKITITVPKRGDKLKLLNMVRENIVVSMGVGDSSLLDLQNKLKLPTLPRVIEAFDISNLGPTGVVGSMVQFKDGKPNKNNYRKFKIKTFQGQSDYDAMHEVVYRRYYRITKEKSELPDLVLVDGGKPQLSAAKKAFAELGLQLPLVALAKKDEEIFVPYSKFPIKLSKRTDALKLLQRLRNEAHRFAITYQRSTRGKRG